MKLPLTTAAAEGAPVPGLVESALRKFLRKELSLGVLYTRGRRQTVAWLGLTDEEAAALVAAKLATSTKTDPDDRVRVWLTLAGIRERDTVAQRDGRKPRRGT